MKRIPLTQGKHALVDDEDFEKLKEFKWYCSAGRKAYPVVMLRMSHVLLKPPAGKFVDHINGNGLDNRRLNLRIVSVAENAKNRKIQKTNTSGFKGVHWRKDNKKWRAVLTSDGKKYNLGHFDSKKQAALAYNKAAKKYHGKFALLNKINKK